MFFLILGETLGKRHRSQDFLFSSSWLPNTGKQGMQTWCNTFLTSSTTHWTFYYHITYLLFFTIATFPGLIVMETEGGKTVNTTNFRQPQGCLHSTSQDFSLPFSRNPPICISTFLCFFFSLQVKSFYSDSGLFIRGL